MLVDNYNVRATYNIKSTFEIKKYKFKPLNRNGSRG